MPVQISYLLICIWKCNRGRFCRMYANREALSCFARYMNSISIPEAVLLWQAYCQQSFFSNLLLRGTVGDQASLLPLWERGRCSYIYSCENKIMPSYFRFSNTSFSNILVSSTTMCRNNWILAVDESTFNFKLRRIFKLKYRRII
mgnify:CR=1 FL=1